MARKTCASFIVAASLTLCAAVVPAVAAPSTSDACSLLTTAQIGPVIGVTVGTGVWLEPTIKTTCTWNTAGGGSVALVVQGPSYFEAGKQQVTPAIVVIPVSGIGDNAYYLAAGNNVGLIVKKGSVAFKVAVYGEESLDQKQAMEKTLAQQVVSAL